jgi:hypothetical protein
LIWPPTGPYWVSKLAAFQWATVFFDTAYKGSLNVVSVHPGLVSTDMATDFFRQFYLDSPLLVGGVCVWVTANEERSQFLSGRITSANWDVEELVARKVDIKGTKQLQMDQVGTLGKEQFESK